MVLGGNIFLRLCGVRSKQIIERVGRREDFKKEK